MLNVEKLYGLYVITDDRLTPDETLYKQVRESLEGGATIVQLRDKHSSDDQIKQKALKLQSICHEYGALFVLNDKIDIAIDIACDGLHIGKSDHERFEQIRAQYNGVIGVSCYGDVSMAKEFENKGADYVAFGSFYTSPTKPNANIVPLSTITQAQEQLKIPVCAIGGINTHNVEEVMRYKPDMLSLVNDIWSSDDIFKRSSIYASFYK
jgi:thiamine-phosphate pyrophosphorylase